MLEGRRQHVDHHIRSLDLRRAHPLVVHVDTHCPPAGMIGDSLLRLLEIDIADGDVPVELVRQLQETVDEVGGALARAENEDLLHRSLERFARAARVVGLGPDRRGYLADLP